MDIEHLNKSQIILLTLLTSFVTSIATGIVTVSLMQQAPPQVAQTVNRIVERTVEKVVPVVQTATAAQPQQQKTIIIKEKDLIAQALAAVRPAVVRIYTTSAEAPVFLGLGLVLNPGGIIAADSSQLGDVSDMVVVLGNGSSVRASVRRHDEATGIAFLNSATTTADGKLVLWTAVSFDKSAPELGDTVFTLGGKELSRIADGIVNAIESGAVTDTSVASSAIVPGGPLFNTEGNLVGISTGVSRAAASSAFITVSAISIEPKAEPKVEQKSAPASGAKQ